ncbi:hypothetical protein CLOM_g20436, partial [Closterium sp. NIES-68]
GLEANVTRRTFVDAYGSAGGRVLCLGDIYESHARFLDPPPGFTSSLAIGWAMPPHAPPPDLQAGEGWRAEGACRQRWRAMGVERRCRSLLWPCDAVVQAAEGFVREVSGTQFAALHLRRDDMYRHCVGQGKCKYWAQRQAASACATSCWGRAGLRARGAGTAARTRSLGGTRLCLRLPRAAAAVPCIRHAR